MMIVCNVLYNNFLTCQCYFFLKKSVTFEKKVYFCSRKSKGRFVLRKRIFSLFRRCELGHFTKSN